MSVTGAYQAVGGSIAPSGPIVIAAPSAGAIADVYNTKATISWTKPSGATSYDLERATNETFTSGVTALLPGTNQFYDDTGLSPNTQYYYRARGKVGAILGDWIYLNVKTTYTPDHNTLGGNRFATSGDAITYADSNVNEGDFIVVGYNSGGNGGDYGFGVFVDSTSGWGPMTNPNSKVVFLGNRGYDWVYINMDLWPGSAGNYRIITNGGGQVRVNNWNTVNPRYVKHTGVYNPGAKTGHKSYPGLYSTDWKKLTGCFGFHMKGPLSSNANGFGYHCEGNCSNVIIEGIEGGEGDNYVAMSIKNDGWPLRNAGNVNQIFSVPNTGAGTWTTLTNTTIVIPVQTSAVRIFADYNGGGGANYKVNWIEFELQSSPFTVTRIQAESFVGKLRATVEATDDVNGVSDITGMSEGSALDYDVNLPPGNYTVRARVSSTVSTGLLTIRLGSITFDGLELRDCYFHDQKAGENIYLFSTQPDPQQKATNTKVHRCLFVRGGLNCIQVGQMVGKNEVYNIIGMNACASWARPFARFQDQATQWSTRTNGFIFRDSVIIGGGEFQVSYFMLQRFPLVSTLATEFNNIATLNSLGGGWYINTKDPGGGTVKVKKCIVGRVAVSTLYRQIYPWANVVPDRVITFESSLDPVFTESAGIATLEIQDNTFDSSFQVSAPFALKAGATANLTITDLGNNVRVSSVAFPKWNNYLDLPNSTPWEAKLQYWTDILGVDWDQFNNAPGTHVEQSNSNDNHSIPTVHPTIKILNVTFASTHPDFYEGQGVQVKADVSNYYYGIVQDFTRSTATTGILTISTTSNVGSVTFFPWLISAVKVYNIDDYVFFNGGRIYRSKVNYNLGIAPSLAGNAFWELIVFSNGSLKPVDDVRLAIDDTYHVSGMGTLWPAPRPNGTFSIKKNVRQASINASGDYYLVGSSAWISPTVRVTFHSLANPGDHLHNHKEVSFLRDEVSGTFSGKTISYSATAPLQIDDIATGRVNGHPTHGDHLITLHGEVDHDTADIMHPIMQRWTLARVQIGSNVTLTGGSTGIPQYDYEWGYDDIKDDTDGNELTKYFFMVQINYHHFACW
jgi:hypothetical protein